VSELHEFRDEDASAPLPRRNRERDDDPYRSPITGGVASLQSSRNPDRRPRISPLWAILIGQTPLYAVLAVLAVAATIDRALVHWIMGLSTLVAAETCAFNVRTAMFGPGSRAARIGAVLLTCVSASTSTGLIYVLLSSVTRIEIPHPTTSLIVVALCIAVPTALARMMGSGERPLTTNSLRTAEIVAFLALTLFAAVLLCVAAITVSGPSLLGSFESWRLPFPVAVLAQYATALFAVTQSWRILVRGVGRRFSIAAAISALSLIAILGGLIVANLVEGRPFVVPTLHVIALVVVPAGREFFLRFAGYRAINVHAERRRTQEQVVAVDDVKS
jgi:hypothetical protein